MQTKIWIIKSSEGEYDDYYEKIICARSYESDADAVIAELNANQELHNSYVDRLEALTNKWDADNRLVLEPSVKVPVGRAAATRDGKDVTDEVKKLRLQNKRIEQRNADAHKAWMDRRMAARREIVMNIFPEVTERLLEELTVPYRTHKTKKSFFKEETLLD